jgi:hypothetical protein
VSSVPTPGGGCAFPLTAAVVVFGGALYLLVHLVVWAVTAW